MIPSVLSVRWFEVHPNPISYRAREGVSSGFRLLRGVMGRFLGRSPIASPRPHHRGCEPPASRRRGAGRRLLRCPSPPTDTSAGVGTAPARVPGPPAALRPRTDRRIPCEQPVTARRTPSVTPRISAPNRPHCQVLAQADRAQQAQLLGLSGHCGKKFVSTSQNACKKSGVVLLFAVATAGVDN